MNKKTIGIALSCCALVVFTGCQQDSQIANEEAQQNKKAKGYVETLASVNTQSRQDIKDAVSKENEKLNKALEDTLGEDDVQKEDLINNNNSQQSNMNNVPKEIDMTLAQTCKGATLKTNKGDITVEFNANKAPIAVANFCTLAEKNFYDGITFHRVIKDFMIQGGDPTGTGMGGTDYKFEDELPAQGEYKLGSLAMANSGPDTNGSQFFIVSGQAGVTLPPLYTLFGQVTEGMDTVNAIQEVETAERDKPVEDVIIEGVELEMK